MQPRWRRSARWVLAGLVAVVVGAVAIVRWDIAQRRDAFDTDARIVHRLLSQRAVEVDAILATLSLLDTAGAGGDAAQRLPALHPPVQRVLQRAGTEPWPDAALDGALRDAEQASRQARRAALGPIDAVGGRYTLVLAGPTVSHALVVDALRLVPWADWPLARDGPVRVELRLGDVVLPLQTGAAPAAQPAGLTPGFRAAKTLASPSQPFEVRLQRATGPAQWPWAVLAGWTLGTMAALAALAAWQRQRAARRRAEELLRLGQVARLNTLGEMAAGIAHELNQPLAAVLANAQAARRRLDDVPADVAAWPGGGDELAEARDAALRDALHLLEPETRRRGVQVGVRADAVNVRADPVALEQILHNLLLNALHALDGVAAGARRLDLQVAATPGQGVLMVADSGPGIAPAMLPRLFQPFATGKPGGLGLGLSLSETLAAGMGGSLGARNREPAGAEFRLALPLAGPESGR